LEIGPGTGVLTDFLKELPVRLTLIEKDTESVEFLKEKYGNTIRILEGDFLQMSFPGIFGDRQVGVIGNFPYNISTQIVFNILENLGQIPEAAGMFQTELAERIAASHGSKVYGILSVLTRLFYDVEILFKVPRDVFYPPPKVQSAVIRLTRKKNPPEVDFDYLKKIVKKVFNQRRKTLRNSLKNANLPWEKLYGEILSLRPEQLSPEDFLNIYKVLKEEDVR
jgi:16S rRNA (adenine1518-N6/adenine1519-N6)-dimethyltransferase